MCELFGVSSDRKQTINTYLEVFFSHSERHPHGWGIACMDEDESFIEKEPVQASKSKYLKERLSLPISVKTAFAHIRYGTIGNVEYKNCHPFTGKDLSGRRWTLIHNGTIFEYAPMHSYVKVQSGDTDSERILLYLIDKVNERIKQEGQALSDEKRFVLMDEILTQMAEGNKLNLLLFDGDLMYVHTNYRDSLYYLDREGTVFFATTPLSEETWKTVPFQRVLAYREGKKVFEGKQHNYEYVDNEENMKFLYQIFSGL